MSNRSSFPNIIDTFVEHRELSATEVTKAKRWRQLRNKDDKTASEIVEYNSLTSELSDAFLTSEDMNKLQDCIVALETFFKENVDGYLDEFQGNFNFRNQWDENVEYSKFNTVTYGGCSFICLESNIGQEPNLEDNTDYWGMIAKKGDMGTLNIKKYSQSVSGIDELGSSWDFTYTTTDTGLTGDETIMAFVNGQSVAFTQEKTDNGVKLTFAKSDIALKNGDKIQLTAFDTVAEKKVTKVNVTIKSTDWVDNVYTYTNDLIKATSVVDIIFNDYTSLIKANQYGVYNYTKEYDGFVKLQSSVTPAVLLNATIIIKE